MKAVIFYDFRLICVGVVILGLIIPMKLISQNVDTNKYWYMYQNDPDANYYTIKDLGWNYFNTHPGYDTTKGTGFKDFIRWDQFWQDRIYKFGDQNAGSFVYAHDEMNEFIENKETFFQDAYNQNIEWNFFGPDNLSTQTMGFVSCIDVNKSSNNYDTIYVGTNASGLFKTINGGHDWFCVTDTIGMPGLGVQDVLVDPSNSSVIYIATGLTTYGRGYGYGKGIYKSVDGGISWQNIFQIANPEQKVVYKILIDPTNSLRIYALINDKVYYSNNGGINWTMIFNNITQPPSGFGKKNLVDIEYKPGTNNTIYISSTGLCYSQNNTEYYLTSEVWKCTNADEEENLIWTRIDDQSWEYNDRIELGVTSAANENVYACFSFRENDRDTFALYKSNDNGNIWELYLKKVTNHNEYGPDFAGCNFHRMELIISPTDPDVFYIGGFFISKITDNGQEIGNNGCGSFGGYLCRNFHVDVRELIILQGSEPSTQGENDILLAGNDGGISRSDDGSDSWVSLNGSGLRITQFYGLAIADDEPQFLSAGSQDNGWFLSRSSNGSWKNIVKGDNYECLVNYFNPKISYSTTFGGTPEVYCTFDGGEGNLMSHFSLPDESPKADWPFIIDPVNPDILYTGLKDVYKITRQNLSFTIDKLSDFVQSHQVASYAQLGTLAIWDKNPQILYAVFAYPTYQNNSCQEKKVFKTMDGGETWIDLTCNLDLLQWLGVTDMAIDPEDHNKVWMTFGGFSTQEASKRVIYTDNSFTDYLDISEGLPNLPVNCIKMGRPDYHELFLGNDAGVFYRNDTMSHWKIYVDGVPVTIFSDIEINKKKNIIYASTFGRGILITEGTLPCPGFSYNDTIFVNADTTWETDIRMHHNLKITSGTHLSIMGTVYMGENNKIFIDRGGELSIDGGKITNSCNSDFWPGIEVWGSKNKSQLQPAFQGQLEMINGATIENALVGIATIKSDSGFHSTESSGGIVQANEANFINNRIHLQFYSYKNFQPWDSVYKNEIPNFSYFENCKFITNNDGYNGQSYGIKMDNISGIHFYKSKFSFLNELDTIYPDYNKSIVFLQNATEIIFKGCEFTNDYFFIDHLSMTPKRGIGLYAYNSSFSVEPFYSDSISFNSTFNKLTYGIKVLSISSARTYTVDSTTFNLTARCIYNSGTRYQTITSNNIVLPFNSATPQFPYYGIYLDYCSQFHVENNDITHNYYNMTTNCLGIIVNNSGEELNMIYRNRFSKLGYGIIAQNDNRGDDNIIGSGLKLKCNEFYNVYSNIYVGPEDAYTRMGISKYQGFFGSPDAPAGNRFSHYIAKDHYTDYHNLQRNIIYFHHDTTQSPPEYNLVPWFYTNWSVTKQMTFDYFDSTSCHSTIENHPREFLTNVINAEESYIDTVNVMLQAWIDGNNTEGLQLEIDTCTPPAGYDLRNSLLNASPYLSDTVLINAVEKEDVLTDALIRDILVENPQSAKSEKIMSAINQRTNLLPEYMIDEIRQGVFTVSQKEYLEAELSYHHQQRILDRNELIQTYFADTASSALDSIENIYINENDKYIKYDLAFHYLNEKDTLNAMDAISSIPAIFPLTQSQQSAHQNYEDFFTMLLDSKCLSAGEFVPDSLELLILHEIDEENSIQVSAWARNILQVWDSLTYQEPIIILDTSLKSAIIRHSENDFESGNECFLKIYPNPSNNFFIVEYKVPDFASGAKISINDLKGTTIKEISLTSSQNQLVLSTETFINGTYICKLVVDSEVKASTKFIIFHP